MNGTCIVINAIATSSTFTDFLSEPIQLSTGHLQAILRDLADLPTRIEADPGRVQPGYSLIQRS